MSTPKENNIWGAYNDPKSHAFIRLRHVTTWLEHLRDKVNDRHGHCELWHEIQRQIDENYESLLPY